MKRRTPPIPDSGKGGAEAGTKAYSRHRKEASAGYSVMSLISSPRGGAYPPC
ncbi:hypothetical protein J2S42_007524 [Catenuloplanes indicus]|uniref:Uncharacterized protein n=1 Tax=Catenuloplanes indicus TaxID=137267 RepID=A0AAE3W9B9_9ACTN|nr:hypothetical protein [Catenuloplanes indicus]